MVFNITYVYICDQCFTLISSSFDFAFFFFSHVSISLHNASTFGWWNFLTAFISNKDCRTMSNESEILFLNTSISSFFWKILAKFLSNNLWRDMHSLSVIKKNCKHCQKVWPYFWTSHSILSKYLPFFHLYIHREKGGGVDSDLQQKSILAMFLIMNIMF